MATPLRENFERIFFYQPVMATPYGHYLAMQSVFSFYQPVMANAIKIIL